ncbi:MAG: MFS transporter [Opitutaceae bacterium]|nr:MFS transporter [Opitutaceae bacterium]
MSSSTASALDLRGRTLIARMNNVPFSRWHMKPRVIMGSATFFDAFDALSLAFVLPVLKGLWDLSVGQVGLLISIGYIGQFIGALFFGSLAEKIGRVKSAMFSIGLMSVMAIGCMLSGNYEWLLVCRFIQGIGVGGEVPVAAVYISELSPTKARGRFFMLYEMIFPIGLMVTGQLGAWLVPSYGWKSMFLVGGVPGIVIAILVLFLPESPRWLISRGRHDEAERLIEQLEASTPKRVNPEPEPVDALAAPAPRADWRELFSRVYRHRTFIVWTLWFCSYLVANGLNNWLPTLYRTVYNLDLTVALRTASLTNVMQVVATLACALLVDHLGRRKWAGFTYAGGAACFIAVALLGTDSVVRVACFATLAYALVGSTNALLYLYTPEIYPTRMRASATGLATAWLRLGSSAGPVLVANLVGFGGLPSVFIAFGLICGVALGVSFFMIETRGRKLEEIAP